MNNLQAAKVAHEASRAIDTTLGNPPESEWEQLTDQQRSDKVDEVAAHVSRHERNVDLHTSAQDTPPAKKLHHYVIASVVRGFLAHHESKQTPRPTIVTEPEVPVKVADEAPPESSVEVMTVAEALAKADHHIAEQNAPPES